MYTCKMTARDWELYDVEGAEGAAATISQAVTDEVRKILAKGTRSLKLAKEARDRVYKVMNEFIGEGARDTEPEGALVTEIEKALGLEEYSLER